MSRYTVKTKDFIVYIGWDRQLGYYHLVIKDKDENMIFSNLDHVNSFPTTYDNYLKIIKELVGVELPVEVLDLLDFDPKNNTGNFEKTFNI